MFARGLRHSPLLCILIQSTAFWPTKQAETDSSLNQMLFCEFTLLPPHLCKNYTAHFGKWQVRAQIMDDAFPAITICKTNLSKNEDD